MYFITFIGQNYVISRDTSLINRDYDLKDIVHRKVKAT